MSSEALPQTSKSDMIGNLRDSGILEFKRLSVFPTDRNNPTDDLKKVFIRWVVFRLWRIGNYFF